VDQEDGVLVNRDGTPGPGTRRLSAERTGEVQRRPMCGYRPASRNWSLGSGVSMMWTGCVCRSFGPHGAPLGTLTRLRQGVDAPALRPEW